MSPSGQSHSLQASKTTDVLTGAGSRSRFDDQLSAVWKAAESSGMPFSVLLFEVDFLTAFRERFGGEASDECLRRIAAAARTALRESSDFLARYGNEEFAVVLPVTDETIAAEVAQRLCRAIRTLELPNPASTVAPVMTLSVGVVTAVPDAGYARPVELLEAAELMLYQAQVGGRNRSFSISDYSASPIAQSLAA